MSSNKSAREELERINVAKRDNEGKLHYYKDISGIKFNRLTAIKYEYTRNKKVYWLCKCECGKEKVVAYTSLKRGNTKSCGCLKHERAVSFYSQLNRKHGMKDTKIYKQWLGMKARCYSKYTSGYKNYGGRGIQVCEEWKSSFLNFYNWAINNGYSNGLTIERVNLNGNYEPRNCKWITNEEQQNNKRNNKYLEFNGEKHTYSEWSRLLNIPKGTIIDRVRRNFTVEQILNTEYRRKKD